MTDTGDLQLPEDPERYFSMDAATALLRLDRLVPSHLREDAVPRAIANMRASLDGTGARRAPITVRRRADGRFDIVDGNTTVHVARMAGWRSIPAVIGP